jgi:hypothetical protein
MITIYIYSLGYKSYKASFLPLIQEGASHIHPSSQRTIVSVLKAHTENTVPFQLSASSSHRPKKRILGVVVVALKRVTASACFKDLEQQ